MKKPPQGEAEGAKEQVGEIPLFLEEVATLRPPSSCRAVFSQVAAFPASIYLCNQMKHLPQFVCKSLLGCVYDLT